MPSSIEWLWPDGFIGESWNPVTGCEKVSPGCAYCYAELFARRFPKSASYSPNYLPGTARIVSHEDRLSRPLHWKKPRFVFVNSQSDLFHEQVSDRFIGAVFAAMWLARQHTYLILTKRPDRMHQWLRPNGWLEVNAALLRSGVQVIPGGTTGPNWPLANVWLGVSAENQRFADARIPLLLDVPAAVRFVSYEPALKPIDFSRWFDSLRTVDGPTRNAINRGMFNLDQIDSMRRNTPDWVIVGGESGGKRARECVGGIEEAMRLTQAQCRAAGVAYFGKQMGSPWAKANGDRGKGENMQLWPEDLRVREWPKIMAPAVV